MATGFQILGRDGASNATVDPTTFALTVQQPQTAATPIVRAVVVETDITRTQNNVNAIQERASF